ncbi:MAG: HNH endonuclease [Pirellulaceae bacterium]|nr:HNH endonuclease [Pirellulaceae bacterium]
MKFELEPDNRGVDDAVILTDLQRVARTLGVSALTQDQYDSCGRFSPATVKKRFGTWNQALVVAGLEVIKRQNIPTDECIAELRRVAALLKQETLSREEFAVHGSISAAAQERRFGSWNKALNAAGFDPGKFAHRIVSDEQAFKCIEVTWRAIGRQPRQADVRPPICEFTGYAIGRRFGSWRKALESFVASMNQGEASAVVLNETTTAENPPSADRGSITRRTSRDPSWRLRFLVMRRDKFACRACGRSPAVVPGVVLVLDHIYPWAKGGETILENLQTLCVECNGGKSDLV